MHPALNSALEGYRYGGSNIHIVSNSFAKCPPRGTLPHMQKQMGTGLFTAAPSLIEENQQSQSCLSVNVRIPHRSNESLHSCLFLGQQLCYRHELEITKTKAAYTITPFM
jgi:hypothetical protein